MKHLIHSSIIQQNQNFNFLIQSERHLNIKNLDIQQIIQMIKNLKKRLILVQKLKDKANIKKFDSQDQLLIIPSRILLFIKNKKKISTFYFQILYLIAQILINQKDYKCSDQLIQLQFLAQQNTQMQQIEMQSIVSNDKLYKQEKQYFFFFKIPLTAEITNRIQSLKILNDILLPITKQNQIENLKSLQQFEGNNDVSQIVALLKKSLIASAKTQGRKVIFLLGKTGSGKSTTVHHLVGICIKDVAQKQPQGVHVPKLQFQGELQGFQVGHCDSSKTKQINVLDTPDLTIVDTAGLNDTNGIKNDIANGIGLEKALNAAQSVKIIFLIKESTIFDDKRGQTIIQLASQLIAYLKQHVQLKQFMKSVVILITHPSHSATKLQQKLINILKSYKKENTIYEQVEKQKIITFLEAMISGAQLQGKRKNLIRLQNQKFIIQTQITRIKKKIAQQELQKFQERIKNGQKQIQKFQQKLKQTDSNQQRQKYINSIEFQKQDKQKNIKRLQQRKFDLKQDFKKLQTNSQLIQQKKALIQGQIQILKSFQANARARNSLFSAFIIYSFNELTDPSQHKKLLQLIKNSPQIQKNDAGNFQISIKNQNQTKVQNMVSEIELSTIRYLKECKYDEVLKYLADICYLDKYIKTKNIKRSKKTCFKHANQSLSDICDKFRKILDDSFSSKGIMPEDNLNYLMQYYKNIKEAQPIVEMLLGEEYNQQKNSAKGLMDYIQRKYKCLIENVSQILSLSQNVYKTANSIDKLEKIYIYFGQKSSFIKSQYKKFSQDFKDTLQKNIKSIRSCIQDADYYKISQHFKYIWDISNIAKKHFKYQLQSLYQQLAQQTNKSIHYRYKLGFTQFLQKIPLQQFSLDKIKILKDNYVQLIKLKKQSNVFKYIKYDTINTCSNEIFQMIYQRCTKLIELLKQLITNKKYKQVQHPLMSFKYLRRIDQRIVSKSCDIFAYFVNQIEKNVNEQSYCVIQAIIKKVKDQKVDKEEIQNLKDIIQELNQKKWIEKLIQRPVIKEIIEKVNKTIIRSLIRIQQDLQTKFFDELKPIQNIQTNDDSEQQSQKSSLGIQYKFQRKKQFEKLNQSLRFVKLLNGINIPDVQTHFEKIKTKISTLIKSQQQKCEKKTQKNDSYELHKFNISKNILKIWLMRSIQFCPLFQLNKSLESTIQNLKSYFKAGNKFISQEKISSYKKIIQCAQSLISLRRSLTYCDTILREFDLNVKQQRKYIRNQLQQKFQKFFKQINENIQNSKFKQSNECLQILNKYKNTEINAELNNQIKDKYNLFYSRLQSKVSGTRDDALSYFSNQNFNELNVLITQYQSNGNTTKSKIIKNQILKLVSQFYDQIIDALTNLDDAKDMDMRNLSKNIKKFQSYEKILDLITQFDYNQKLKIIIRCIEQHYKKLTDQILTMINKNNFSKLRNKINRQQKFYSTILYGMDKQNKYKIQKVSVEQKLQQQIKKIIDNKIEDQYDQYLINYKKLISYDNDNTIQNQKLSDKYKKMITDKIKLEMKNIEIQLSAASQINALNIVQQKLIKLKQSVAIFQQEKIISQSVKQKLQQINKDIQGYLTLFTGNNTHTTFMLDNLRNTSKTTYCVQLKQIYTKMESQNQKLINSKKDRNYSNVAQSITILQKYQQIRQHLKISGKDKILDNVRKIKKQIYQRCGILYQKIDLQLQKQIITKTADLSQFEEYFDILINVEFQHSYLYQLSYAKNIHQKIIQCLNKIVPKAIHKESVLLEHHRMEIIVKYQTFINMLKEYIKKVSHKNKKTVFPQGFIEAIKQIQTAAQSEGILKLQIEKLPVKFQCYWDNTDFKKLSQQLFDLQKLNTKQLSQMYTKLTNQLRQMISKLSKESLQKIQLNQLQGLQQNINKLNKAQKQLKCIPGLISGRETQNITNQLCKYIESTTLNQMMKNISSQQVDETIDNMIQLKQWVNKLPIIETSIDGYIVEGLKQIVKRKLTVKIVNKLEQRSNNKLNAIAATYCGEIMDKHKKLLQIPRIMPKLTKNLTDIIKEFNADPKGSIHILQLQKAYKIYQNQYQSLRNKFIQKATKSDIQKNLKKIQKLVFESIDELGDQQNVGFNPSSILPLTLARLFTYYSLFSSADTFYDKFEQTSSENANQHLIQPTKIQILSILRFLGCDNNDNFFERTIKGVKGKFTNINKLPNHLMQIKTGEGKSIILAIMSLLLALMGNKVYCVCYSNYLSERDYNDFENIFEAFKVKNKITYGTFATVSQKIINQKGDLRQLVKNLFIPSASKQYIKQNKSQKKNEQKKRVLLVDEVDTFFSQNFYGNTYNPSALIQNQNIIKIVKFIWNNRLQNQAQIMKLLKQTILYKNICIQFKDCIHQITNQFNQMINDVKNFDKRPYIVKQDRIGYKELDGIQFNTVYGYQTMFLYLYQYQRKNILDENVIQQNLGISLSCGKFSYAEIIHSFDKIFGVSGTLQYLNQFEKKIVQSYDIKVKTYAPSVYSKSKIVQQRILIQNGESQYFFKISKTINDVIKSKSAVLVFFENQKQLKLFQGSSYFKQLKGIGNSITQELSKKQRDYLIKQSTKSSHWTLLTASFGRGTDFKVYDPLVKQKGVYVIQTFLSEQISQQIQIMGRTARQDLNGTYQLIVNLQQIQKKYNITQIMIKKARQDMNDSVQKLFSRMRNIYYKQISLKREKKVNQSLKEHKQSMKKRDQIINLTIKQNDSFFFKNGKQSSNARIMILIDSTGSMGKVINAVKGKVMDMIKNMSSKYPSQFQIQIMFYYGYNCYDSQKKFIGQWGFYNKLHHSQWTNDVQVLKKFTANAKTSGGSNHEAIEVALHHLLKAQQQKGVKRAMLFGDAGLDEVIDPMIDYCVHPDDAYRYSKEQIKQPIKLSLNQLLKQLRSKNIKVDTYPIGNYQNVKLTCKKISEETNGKMTSFDPVKDDLATEIETKITQCIMMKR